MQKSLMLTIALAVSISGASLPRVARSQESAADTFQHSTPRQLMTSFVTAAHDEDWATAQYALELSAAERRSRGEDLARKFSVVLERTVWLDPESLGDEPATAVGQRRTISEIPYLETRVPVTIVSVRDGHRNLVWVVSSSLVSKIPELYAAHGPGWIEALFPEWVRRYRVWDIALWKLITLVVVLFLAVALGRALNSAFMRFANRVASRTAVAWDDELVRALRGPSNVLVTVIVTWLAVEPLRLPRVLQDTLDRVLQILMIGGVAWLAIRALGFAAFVLERRAEEATDESGNRDQRLRGLRTQLFVMRRVISIVIGLIAAALMLVQFEVVRSVGLSLLASAGVAGIVIGLAAQRSLATLLAGIQISITQPIRIGDTVIVEGEWGRIEEINLTYVIVKIWDERRLIVPISRFLDAPFQNWTRVAPQLLGTIFFHADYTLPIDAARKELDRILDGNPAWDGRVKSVLVTDVKDRTIEVRALISAKNSDDQWNLRCEVREKMIAWLRDFEDGRYLPKIRVEGSPALTSD